MITTLHCFGRSASEESTALHSSRPNALDILDGLTIAHLLRGVRTGAVIMGLDLLSPDTLSSVEVFGSVLQPTDYFSSNADELLGLTDSHDVAYLSSRFGRIRWRHGYVGTSLPTTCNARRYKRVISAGARPTGFSFARQPRHCRSGNWAQRKLYEFKDAPSMNLTTGVNPSTRYGRSNTPRRMLEALCEGQATPQFWTLASQQDGNGQDAPPGPPGVQTGRTILPWAARHPSRPEVRSARQKAMAPSPPAGPGSCGQLVGGNWDLDWYQVSTESKRP
jgi:hypothetical protein